MVVTTYPALPRELSAKLSSLGAKLKKGPSDSELNDVLDALSEIPPNQVVRISRDIATAARLGWWLPEEHFSLQRLFRKPLSESDLLKRNPNYAWLFLFHYSGYVREAALDVIHTPPASAFFFAALAWRLNDWVEPVRQAAKRCAERVLPLTNADIVASAALYLLDRRLVWGRWSDEPGVLDSIFSRKEVVAALAVRLCKQTTGPLATCLRYALRYPNIDEYLPGLAAYAIQPAVRAVAYQCLLAGRAAWPVGHEWEWIDRIYGLKKRVPKLDSRAIGGMQPIPELVRQGVLDKSPKVRSVAADALTEIRSQLPDADSLIAKLAKDRSPAVRWRADFMLRHPVAHQPHVI